MAEKPNRTSRTRDVVQLLGVSRRQLQYWSTIGLVMPSEKTPGGHNRYTHEDIEALRTVKSLIDSGISIQRIQVCVDGLHEFFPSIKRPLSELNLYALNGMVLMVLPACMEWLPEEANA